jgi:hexulose-6-phosphate isomerase
MSITSKIGIMQGRLSPRIEGKIQAFPVEHWASEFRIASEIGFSSIEWIVENPLDLNPFFRNKERDTIKDLISETKVKVDFICADIFMQVPITNDLSSMKKSKELIRQICSQAAEIGARFIEIPFVDNSSIRNIDHSYLIDFFNSFENQLIEKDLFINLETDLDSLSFKKLLNNMSERIGANYDIGNSASLGYDFEEELSSYGERINNVHIKDRVLGGSTVEFGTGDSNIKGVLKFLSNLNYDKGIVIQGARGVNDIKTAQNQLEFTKKIINDLINE